MGQLVLTPYFEEDGITIYHGDCREIDAWMAADMLITDPPYGIGYDSSRRRLPTTVVSCANDDDTSVRDDALVLWGKARR